jgi:hypothetical protein
MPQLARQVERIRAAPELRTIKGTHPCQTKGRFIEVFMGLAIHGTGHVVLVLHFTAQFGPRVSVGRTSKKPNNDGHFHRFDRGSIKFEFAGQRHLNREGGLSGIESPMIRAVGLLPTRP